MFFESNLPSTVPYWLDARAAKKFTETIERIKKRMALLECALDITGMKGETFALYAQKLFEMDTGKFDALTAEDIAGFVSMMDTGIEVQDRMHWENAFPIVDTAFLRTEEWEVVRHIGIGGSEAAAVLGISPYQTAAGLYYSKIGTPLSPEFELRKNWSFDRGHVLEPFIIETFCSITGAKVIKESRMFGNRKHPSCTANIDAIVQFPDGRIFIFEAKSTIKGNWDAWAAGKIPGHYIPQMRQYPAVLDDDRIAGTFIGCCFTDDTVVSGLYVGSQFDGDKFVTRYLERDKTREEELLMEEERWFQAHIEKNDVPPMNGDPDREQEVIKTYLQRLPTKEAKQWLLAEVETDIKEWLHLKESYSAIQKKGKALDADAKSIAVRLIEKLGDATQAEVDLGDSRYYEIKNSPRSKGFIDSESLSILIDTAAAYLPTDLTERLRGCIGKKEDVYRVFSIKEKTKKRKSTA